MLGCNGSLDFQLQLTSILFCFASVHVSYFWLRVMNVALKSQVHFSFFPDLSGVEEHLLLLDCG